MSSTMGRIPADSRGLTVLRFITTPSVAQAAAAASASTTSGRGQELFLTIPISATMARRNSRITGATDPTSVGQMRRVLGMG